MRRLLVRARAELREAVRNWWGARAQPGPGVGPGRTAINSYHSLSFSVSVKVCAFIFPSCEERDTLALVYWIDHFRSQRFQALTFPSFHIHTLGPCL